MIERRPIEKVGGSFKPEKFAWLWQVARDPAAQYGLPLAVQLVLGHVNNEHGKCNPGDEKLRESLNRSTKTIQRMRKVLTETGHLQHQPSGIGLPRDGGTTHTLLLDPTPTGGHTGVHQSDPTGGQISPDRWTEKARPVDSEKCQVIDPPNKSVPNLYEPVLNQGREPHHYEKTATVILLSLCPP
jgi:hypothetical protein